MKEYIMGIVGYKEQLHENQQTIKQSEIPKHKKHIASGGIVQLYFIHHFN
jgi:hypothetical protein